MENIGAGAHGRSAALRLRYPSLRARTCFRFFPLSVNKGTQSPSAQGIGGGRHRGGFVETCSILTTTPEFLASRCAQQDAGDSGTH